jgi:hypothetical protein
VVLEERQQGVPQQRRGPEIDFSAGNEYDYLLRTFLSFVHLSAPASS